MLSIISNKSNLSLTCSVLAAVENHVDRTEKAASQGTSEGQLRCPDGRCWKLLLYTC